jgi:hypothetical protein
MIAAWRSREQPRHPTRPHLDVCRDVRFSAEARVWGREQVHLLAVLDIPVDSGQLGVDAHPGTLLGLQPLVVHTASARVPRSGHASQPRRPAQPPC